MGQVARRYDSQRELGAALNIHQQNASRLLKDRHAGFSYATAQILIRLAGLEGVDVFFVSKGIGPPSGIVDVEDTSLHGRSGAA